MSVLQPGPCFFAACTVASLPLFTHGKGIDADVALRHGGSCLPLCQVGDGLPPSAIGRLGTVSFRQPLGTTRVAWSADGESIVGANGYSGPVLSWHADTGHARGRLLANAE